MKKYLLFIFLSTLISTSVFARSTGCKEGNCENGYGKWVYTDKTTYEGEWVKTKKQGQGVETWPNGYVYEGEFQNSVWSGQGILTFPEKLKFLVHSTHYFETRLHKHNHLAKSQLLDLVFWF